MVDKQLMATPALGAAHRSTGSQPLCLLPVRCCLCGSDHADPVGVGEDFEYRTSPDTFLVVRCNTCGLIYLNPRPSIDDLPRIYPPDYHALDFSASRFGLAYYARQRLEARRLLSYCRGLTGTANILDVGCGDGFHLQLLRRYGKPGWTLEGVDVSEQAVAAARKAGLNVHLGLIQELQLPEAGYDLILLIATIEHIDDPLQMLSTVRRLLRPGGRVVVITDNAESPDFSIFSGRHWGGYHFPRHWNLFTDDTLRRLASKAGLRVESLETVCSPVNWVYSIRNLLVDRGASPWWIERFSLSSTGSLTAFTLLDTLFNFTGRGALLRIVLRKT